MTSTPAARILPGETPEEYLHFVEKTINYFRFESSPEVPATRDDLAAELADLRWRLRRVPAYEARVIAAEMHLITRDPEQAELIEGFSTELIEALAVMRLIDRKVLTTLYNQEARLNRRAERIQKSLEAERPQAQPSGQPQKENCKNEPNSTPSPQSQASQSAKIGRNEPCPCGSNLKFKRCCGNPLRAQAASTAAVASAA